MLTQTRAAWCAAVLVAVGGTVLLPSPVPAADQGQGGQNQSGQTAGGSQSRQGQPGQDQQQQNQPVRRIDLIGTWRLVQYKYGTAPDLTDFPGSKTQIKHITPTHFAWLRYDSNGQVQTAAGGTFRLDNNQQANSSGGGGSSNTGGNNAGSNYAERIEYGMGDDVKPMIGQEQTYTLRLEANNRLHIIGSVQNSFKIEEVWERVPGQGGPNGGDWQAELRGQSTAQGGAQSQDAQQAAERQAGQQQSGSGSQQRQGGQSQSQSQSGQGQGQGQSSGAQGQRPSGQ